MTFPPIVARTMIEKLGYLDNFPQLIGSVHSYFGSDAQAREMAERARNGERWEDLLDITEVMLLPAACYPGLPDLQRPAATRRPAGHGAQLVLPA